MGTWQPHQLPVPAAKVTIMTLVNQRVPSKHKKHLWNSSMDQRTWKDKFGMTQSVSTNSLNFALKTSTSSWLKNRRGCRIWTEFWGCLQKRTKQKDRWCPISNTWVSLITKSLHLNLPKTRTNSNQRSFLEKVLTPKFPQFLLKIWCLDTVHGGPSIRKISSTEASRLRLLR